jgi:hypothetical protein
MSIGQPTHPIAMATTPARDPAVALPGALPRFPALSRRVRVTPLAGRIALGLLIAATFAVVAVAASDPSILVPHSKDAFPNWEAGPLHFVIPRPITDPRTLDIVYSIVLVGMVVAYGLILSSIDTFRLRTIAIAVIVLHAIVLLSPPLQLTDVFNYLGYARLGALHHLSPYTHTIHSERFDPVFVFASWHNLKSPYGELFTMLSYPLGLLPLWLAYWILKVAIVLLSLGFVALLYRIARQLGRDPRFVIAFVVLNPVFLIYELGAFHNDYVMLVPSMGAISLMLARRDRWAGASLAAAIAVKFTAVLLGPFLLLAVATRSRQLRLVAGAAIAAVPLLIVSVILFGASLPNLQQQSSLLTDFSIPNLVGLIFGLGGTHTLLDLADVIAVLVVLYLWLVRRGDWLVGAGLSTLVLIASLSWAVPWYVVWVLPLAALSRSRALRTWSVIAMVFLMVAFLPATSLYMADHHINPLRTPAGRASEKLQSQLAN